jgi:hypothetical protein
MPSKKSLKLIDRQSRTRVLSSPVRTNKQCLPPLFVALKLRRSIERLLPEGHHRRLHLYFDTYGGLRCLRVSVLYGANGFCNNCLRTIEKRLRKIDKELQARVADPPPDPDKAYLRPYDSARQLLADLVPKMGKRSTLKKPGPKSPTNVYLKALA